MVHRVNVFGVEETETETEKEVEVCSDINIILKSKSTLDNCFPNVAIRK